LLDVKYLESITWRERPSQNIDYKGLAAKMSAELFWLSPLESVNGFPQIAARPAEILDGKELLAKSCRKRTYLRAI
jgi:hypothetical protein